MKNSFEKFTGKSKPENTEQFSESREDFAVQLVEDAKSRAEGVVSYAPIPQVVKERLLTAIEDIEIGRDTIPVQSFIESEVKRGGTEETAASLYVDRHIRSALAQSAEDLGDDFRMLQLALDGLYSSDSYADDLVRKWMNKETNK